MKQIKIYTLTILLVFTTSYCSWGQSNTIKLANSRQIRLENLQSKIDSIVSKAINPLGPGLSVGIIYKGQAIVNAHYGFMNLDYQMPVTDSTAYNLASVSKHITAFGILLLESQGKLRLEDEIGKYIPNLVYKETNITIKQLLHHTSGIPSTDNLKLFSNISLDSRWTMNDELELLNKYPQLNFEPGTEFMYSNGGYSLLAAIIESASGKDFATFFTNDVFEPLRLKAAVYNVQGKIIKNRAKGYASKDKFFETVLTEAESVPGATNFYFSMKDMLQWMKLLIGEDSAYKTIFSKMRMPSVKLPSGDTISYSYGLDVMAYKNVKSVSHSGGTPGFSSYIKLFPEYSLGIAIMANNENTNVVRIAHAISDSLLADYIKENIIVKHTEIKLKEPQLKKWIGSYRMKDGATIKVIFKENKLFLESAGSPHFQIYPESATNFFVKEFDTQIKFMEGGYKEPVKLNIIHGIDIQTGFNVNSNVLILPPPAAALLIGSYHHPQLAITYQITVKDGQLIIKLPSTFKKYFDISETILTSIGGDVYNTDRLGVVEFSRNEKNEISGFKFNDTGRLRNIKFLKLN